MHKRKLALELAGPLINAATNLVFAVCFLCGYYNYISDSVATVCAAVHALTCVISLVTAYYRYSAMSL